MLKPTLNTAMRRIVGVAMASTVGAGGYACSTTSATPGGAGLETDGGSQVDAGPFADESTFACESPLSDVLGNLVPTEPVDYVELRARSVSFVDGGLDVGAGPGDASASHGAPCATATDHDACVTALAALSFSRTGPYTADGWYTDGSGGLRYPVAPETKELLVFTRGNQVGALRTTAEVAAFLGSIDTVEEARLLLIAQNQPLVCTAAPHKSGWRKNDDGSWELLITGATCGGPLDYQRRYRVAKDGVVTKLAEVQDHPGIVCGRRPSGLRMNGLTDGAARDLGEHFAHSAHLEAASVIAFRRLEHELRRFGAPASFATRAKRARADEIEHARDTASLARRFGGVVPAVDVAPMAVRDLFAFALENAVEGAVRETYGALVAAFQAERAAPELRPLLRRIARDEARHAELAHDIDRWVQPKLSADERARLAAARAAALDELRAAITTEPHDSVLRVAGMPNAAAARILLDGLDREILAAA